MYDSYYVNKELEEIDEIVKDGMYNMFNKKKLDELDYNHENNVETTIDELMKRKITAPIEMNSIIFDDSRSIDNMDK